MNQERNPTKALRLAVYARVSSEHQAEDGTSDSQLSLLRRRIARDGGAMAAYGCFSDAGVSGTTLLRPGLERLRGQAAAGAIDRLYMLTPDRLARRQAHQLAFVEELQAHGVEVLFVNRPLGETRQRQN